MTTTPKTSLLFVKLPKQLVERLQNSSPEELQLVLGGKERITTGTIGVGEMRYDVRYSSERASAPPLLYQGASPQATASAEGWTQWKQCGKLAGKLTLVGKARSGANVPSGVHQMQSDDIHAKIYAPSAAIQGSDGVDAMGAGTLGIQAAGGLKAAPQKRPGILRQNREILHDRLLHLLALGPVDEAGVLEKFNGPKSAVLEMLETMGKRLGDGKWALQDKWFKDIEIETWPKYSAADRERVIANALHAFDALGLPTDDPSRTIVLRIRKRLRDGGDSGTRSVGSMEVSAPAADGPRVPKGPTVPSLSLPKEKPTPKKKPGRSMIAPTLVRKVHMEANKAAKRLGMPGVHATGTSNAAEGGEGVAASAQQRQGSADDKDPTQHSVGWTGRPAPPPSANESDKARTENVSGPPAAQGGYSEGEYVQDGVKVEAMAKRQKMTSGSNSIPSTAVVASGSTGMSIEAAETARGNPRNNLVASRSTNDIHSDRPQQGNGAEHRRTSSSSRRRRRSSNDYHIDDQQTERRQGDSDVEEQGQRHVPVRSRPLHLAPTAFTAMRRSPNRSRDAETGAAVSRVQERLAQEMAAAASSDRRLPGLNTAESDKAAKGAGSSEAMRGAAKRPRGPSLSSITDEARTRSPSPEPSLEQPETVEDVMELQKLLVAMYSEYSQLRLKIDSHCSEFAPVADEYAKAQEAYDTARRRAAEHEEGEEMAGEGFSPSSTTLGLAVAPAHDKCTPDGARLYWADAVEGDADAWVADSPDAVVGQETDAAGLACRMRRLLPEEARMLRASQAAVDKYDELDGADAQRWVRRYLQLHVQIEQTHFELLSAHSRISSALEAQINSYRDELGDACVDDILAEDTAADADADSNAAATTLAIDMYRDDDLETAATP
ncbi:hypothetical protein EV175_001893 [Coemansia sp. RSA 1933]|nr:hypothetical protein EV175_001893 [Coemansia sp. RSA 1933]